MSIVYLNGQYLPKEQATISVMDRGFLFGDGIYEGFPVYQGNVFCIDEHLNRLQKSLSAINITLDIDHEQWKDIFQTLIEKNPRGDHDQAIYMQITRGAADKRTHAYPPDIKPTIFICVSDYHAANQESVYQGFKAITFPDIRWHNCYIKSINLLPNILASQQAIANDAKDAIFIRDGYVIEAASSNVFIVKNNTILTPPLSHYMLPGITRDLMIQLAMDNHLACEQTLISEDQLRDADEIWLTGSLKEVCPITTLDDQTIGNGQAGPITRQMLDIYNQHKTNFIQTQLAKQ